MIKAATALTLAKFAVSGVVGIGTGKIVSGIIKNHVEPKNLIDKVTITAAAWVISGIATKATKKYTNEVIDEVFGTATEQVGNFKEAGKLTKIERGQSTFEEEGLHEEDYKRDTNGKYKRIKPGDKVVDSTVSDVTDAPFDQDLTQAGS